MAQLNTLFVCESCNDVRGVVQEQVVGALLALAIPASWLRKARVPQQDMLVDSEPGY
jgi:hypothetical protein